MEIFDMVLLQWGRGVMPRKTTYYDISLRRPTGLQWGRAVMPRKTK